MRLASFALALVGESNGPKGHPPWFLDAVTHADTSHGLRFHYPHNDEYYIQINRLYGVCAGLINHQITAGWP